LYSRAAVNREEGHNDWAHTGESGTAAAGEMVCCQHVAEARGGRKRAVGKEGRGRVMALAQE
jgi:hypothetical protein